MGKRASVLRRKSKGIGVRLQLKDMKMPAEGIRGFVICFSFSAAEHFMGLEK